MLLWRFLLLILIGIVGLVSLTIWFFPTTQDFHVRNPSWNGLESFIAQYSATPLISLGALPEGPEGTILLVIPLLLPDEDDLQRLKTYVEDGGMLILADDWGEGNTILEGLGLSARFSGSILHDPLFNAGDRRLPLATDLAFSPVTAGVTSILLNYATTLHGPGILELVRSSPLSYLDIDANGTRSSALSYLEFDADGTEEPTGPFLVVGLVELGEGRLILLSDPSIFINAMLEKEDNARLVGNIIGLAGEEPRVFIDQALLSSTLLDKTRNFLESVRKVISHPLLIAALVISVVIMTLTPLRRRREGETVWNETI